jgi:hypothetical protein
MEIHQSPLDHIHQDMFEYKTIQDDGINQNLNEVNHLILLSKKKLSLFIN